MGQGELRREWLKCAASCHYFIHNYVSIYDATEGAWISFKLWPAQAKALYKLIDSKLTVILKARQLGQTWMVLGFALWLMIFHPAVTVLLFSRRDDEAQYLLDRVRGMYDHLPDWMRVRKVVSSSAHTWQLSNGSIAYGFPTTAGDSYTASLAIVDEADLVPDLDRLMNAVKPTIDGGGRMILLSRTDKTQPNSPFKRIYRAAKQGLNGWGWVFLPWNARPERTQEWYDQQKADILSRTGSIDDLHQQYPATDSEALAPRTLDKRVPPMWVEQCYVEMKTVVVKESIPDQTQVYFEPEWNHKYVIGADPAEGNPSSDPSSLHVLDRISGEEVAALTGQFEPSTFASYAAQLSEYYNWAEVLPERNNHGHAFILWLKDNAPKVIIGTGSDGDPGWQTNSKSKAMMWSLCADIFRDGDTTIHSQETFFQICDIEGATLKAPKGAFDDRAVSFCLALLALSAEPNTSFAYDYIDTKGGHHAPNNPTDRRAKGLSLPAQ